MILATHEIVGAAIVASMPAHPVLGVTLALTSHYILDSIPHWEYKRYSDSINPHVGGKMKFDKQLFVDLFKIGTDFFVGLFFSFILFFNPHHPWLFLLGAFFGVLPDIFQFLCMRVKYKPLIYLQKIHDYVHSKRKIDNPYWGATSQMIAIYIVVFLTS